jgi:peptide deformylase
MRVDARRGHRVHLWNVDMARLPIIEYPDPRLKTVAATVTSFDDRLRKLVADLAETMYAAPGVGLAATQVDVHQRIIVIDVSEAKDRLQVFINPEIVARSDERRLCEEGCLSVPGIYDEVERPSRVTVRAQDPDGRSFDLDCEGLLATCVQHEMDHLIGRVFVDYLSSLKQNRIRTKLRKRKSKEEA